MSRPRPAIAPSISPASRAASRPASVAQLFRCDRRRRSADSGRGHRDRRPVEGSGPSRELAIHGHQMGVLEPCRDQRATPGIAREQNIATDIVLADLKVVLPIGHPSMMTVMTKISMPLATAWEYVGPGTEKPHTLRCGALSTGGGALRWPWGSTLVRTDGPPPFRAVHSPLLTGGPASHDFTGSPSRLQAGCEGDRPSSAVASHSVRR